jgi:hypothetical protein
MSETILEHDGLTITRPCKHSINLDWSTPTGTRVHLRLYAFTPGQVEGEWVEVPAELTLEAAELYQQMSLDQFRAAKLAGIFEPTPTASRDLLAATYPQPMALTLLAVESAYDLRRRYGPAVVLVRPRTVGFVEIELESGARHLLPSQVWQDYQWAANTREVLP